MDPMDIFAHFSTATHFSFRTWKGSKSSRIAFREAAWNGGVKQGEPVFFLGGGGGGLGWLNQHGRERFWGLEYGKTFS